MCKSDIPDDVDLLLQLTVPLLQLLDLFVSLDGRPCAQHLIRRHASTLQLPLQAQFLLLQSARVQSNIQQFRGGIKPCMTEH